jgi:glutamate formiminotransferase/formiminotetrahydrofolate cyclodeaminase
MAGREMRKLIECVPNFSEGRDRRTVEAIRDAIASTPGARLLRWEMDPDHNRSVMTFVGTPEAVSSAAFAAIRKAAELIDLSAHAGEHPRIGAADVVPFVPLEGAVLDDCVALARELGAKVWERLGVPVYFYEAAARTPERRKLEDVRRGGFERPALKPDLGGPALHPTAGGCVIGARNFLIAFNVNLDTSDDTIARQIARRVRASSGGLPFVKAIGVSLASRNVAQVSLNLTDFEHTPPHVVFELVKREAHALGAAVVGSEIIGLVPKKAVEMAAEFYLAIENFSADLVLENHLSRSGGLSEFLDEIALPVSPKGGGSAAAAAGAMAAALGEKVRRLAKLEGDFESFRAFFSDAVERDAAAFQAYLQQGEAALEQAASVPLEVAEFGTRLSSELGMLERQAPAKFASDVQAALGLARVAVEAAIAAVRANLILMRDEQLREKLEERVRAIQ